MRGWRGGSSSSSSSRKQTGRTGGRASASHFICIKAEFGAQAGLCLVLLGFPTSMSPDAAGPLPFHRGGATAVAMMWRGARARKKLPTQQISQLIYRGARAAQVENFRKSVKKAVTFSKNFRACGGLTLTPTPAPTPCRGPLHLHAVKAKKLHFTL